MEIGGGSEGVEGKEEKRKRGCLQELEENGGTGEMKANGGVLQVEDAWG